MANDNKKSRLPWLITTLLLVVIIIILLLRSCEPEKAPVAGELEWDPSVTEGVDLSGLSQEEIQDMLNKKVKDSEINISMSTHPIFENGTTAGPLKIVNNTVNNYPMSVQIHRNDTGECIYASAAIPIGSKIENDTLDVDLPAGEYDCTATFSSLNPDNGLVRGQAKAIIKVTVLH